MTFELPVFQTVLPAVVFQAPVPLVMVAPSPVCVSQVQVAAVAEVEPVARNKADAASADSDDVNGVFI